MRETLIATDCWFVWNGGSFARERSRRKPLGNQEEQQPTPRSTRQRRANRHACWAPDISPGGARAGPQPYAGRR